MATARSAGEESEHEVEADDRDDRLHPPGRASGEDGVDHETDNPDEAKQREDRHECDEAPSGGASAVDHHDGSLHGTTLGSRSGARWLAGSVLSSGRIAQLARARPLQGRCRGFESLCAHRFVVVASGHSDDFAETVDLPVFPVETS